MKNHSPRLTLCVVLATLFVAACSNVGGDNLAQPDCSPAGVCSQYRAVAPTTGPRWLGQATLLANGKVLSTGGAELSAELYDPASQTWSPVMGAPMGGLSLERHASTALPNGKVLISGGMETTRTASRKTWLYDPVSNRLQPGPAMATPHAGHTATLLENGNVVIAGGHCPYGNEVCTSGSTELYDAKNNSFSALAAMPVPVKHAAAVLLANGTVLLAGGLSGAASAQVQIYNPATNRWTAANNSAGPSLIDARYYHTATRLADGRVLVLGGSNPAAGPAGRLNSVELYNPATGMWTAAAPMLKKRFAHTATLMPNGAVLAVGGYGELNSDTTTASVEHYDPKLDKWLQARPLINARNGHTATLLSDGSLLVANGFVTDSAGTSSAPRLSAQIWKLADLLR